MDGTYYSMPIDDESMSNMMNQYKRFETPFGILCSDLPPYYQQDISNIGSAEENGQKDYCADWKGLRDQTPKTKLMTL